MSILRWIIQQTYTWGNLLKKSWPCHLKVETELKFSIVFSSFARFWIICGYKQWKYKWSQCNLKIFINVLVATFLIYAYIQSVAVISTGCRHVYSKFMTMNDYARISTLELLNLEYWNSRRPVLAPEPSSLDSRILCSFRLLNFSFHKINKC